MHSYILIICFVSFHSFPVCFTSYYWHHLHLFCHCLFSSFLSCSSYIPTQQMWINLWKVIALAHWFYIYYYYCKNVLGVCLQILASCSIPLHTWITGVFQCTTCLFPHHQSGLHLSNPPSDFMHRSLGHWLQMHPYTCFHILFYHNDS